ncbi:hypothetical protein BJY04DRAFT_223223 [Aspergillus karnatakaensis]|uniref:uncharacterized protein n=1 Tax=Aspergillus karnatakaensis TaxID=1810916 RepID=UPI003CCCB706
MRPSTLLITQILAGVQLVSAADCGGTRSCVRLYSDVEGTTPNVVAEYSATCEGNCFVINSKSVQLSGAVTYGVDCIFYQDSSCQNPLPDDQHDSAGALGTQFYDFGGQPSGSHKCFAGCTGYWNCQYREFEFTDGSDAKEALVREVDSGRRILARPPGLDSHILVEIDSVEKG